MPGVTLSFIPPIPHAVRRALDLACRRIHLVTDIRHSIPITVVPRVTVDTDDGVGWGAFHYRCYGKSCRIIIAGLCPAGFGRSEHLAVVVETLCHEISHYEQWRDGCKVQERGVAVRARTLVKLLTVATPTHLTKKH